MQRIITILFAVLFLLGSSALLAQDPDKPRPKKGKGLILRPFKPTDTTSVLVAPRLSFPNINKLRYYYDEKALAAIKKLEANKEWRPLLLAVKKYVGNFGIENFKRDIDLVWLLARTAEHEAEMELAKDVWRVIIKHYRGHASQRNFNPSDPRDWGSIQNKSLQAALHHYDSLTEFEKDLYVDLDYYYALVEKRKAIDTLRPPESIMLNMGDAINSSFEEYGLTIGGVRDDIIYFTTNRLPDSSKISKDWAKPGNEDIYFAEKEDDDFWGMAQPFENINTQYNEGSPCMNKAGDMLIFARCFSPDGLGNCDLYVSFKLEAHKWSVAQNLGPNVNSSLWDSHPSLSITEDTLYFSSDRQGGFGGSDIYFSVKDKKGRWGISQNVGPTINTQMSEVSPHIHPTRNVLFFSSNGQMLNFGDFDIFKSYWVDNQWTEPKNIGPLVNGKGSEIYFAIDSKAQNLFYSKSHEHELRNLDLYSFPLPMEAQPNAVFRFSGKVTEPTTGEVFIGVVTIIDLDEHVEVAPKYTRSDGSFEFDLVNNRRYLLVIEGDNFFRIEEVFQMEKDGTKPSAPSDTTATDTLFSMGKEVKKVLTFASIDFDPSSAKLKPEMENNLHLVIDFLVENPDFNCRVIGHTDADGNEGENLALSKERAESIRKYLLDYGSLAANRVMAIGMGSKGPIVTPEKTPEDKKRNRRVEFEIYRQ